MKLFCPGPFRRREFLRAGMLALGGMGLEQILAAQARAGQPTKNTSVILFWMWGGPSHLETYDLKPLAPSEYRGPFRPIPTDVPGPGYLRIVPAASAARLAHLARAVAASRDVGPQRRLDRAVDRQNARPPRSHFDCAERTSRLRHGGQQAARRPARRAPELCRHPAAAVHDAADLSGAGAFGGCRRRPVEQTVSAAEPVAGRGRRCQPTGRTARPAAAIRPLTPRPRPGRLARRRRAVPRPGAAACSPTPSVADAFDVSREHRRDSRSLRPAPVGAELPPWRGDWREAGVAVITIDALAPTLSDRYFSWDDHINPITRWDMADAMRYRAPFMDQGSSALIEDIYERGLSTASDGRGRRRIRPHATTGRPRWSDRPRSLARRNRRWSPGGGLRMGQVVGATNSKGEFRPTGPHAARLAGHHLSPLWASTIGGRLSTSPGPRPDPRHGEPIRELV